jgi:drug/metabolite transporter (DMT)-like permease
VRGKLGELFAVFKTRDFKWLVIASAIGGPVGMTGYVLAVKYMGASIGAVASAVYPAIGTALACVFLKERVQWYRWILLGAALLGVFGLSYSPTLEVESFWLGIVGALMCAFGWGTEGVILAKCLRSDKIKSEYALNIRQAVSAVIYGAIIIPALGGVRFTAGLFSGGSGMLLLTLAVAALMASVSYLLYYKTIGRIGPSKAMALNITYTAWAIVFTVVILRDTSVISLTTVLCAAVVVVCGILSATSFGELFGKRRDK